MQGAELTVKAETEIVHFMDNRVVAMPPHGGVYPTINLGPAGVRALSGVCHQINSRECFTTLRSVAFLELGSGRRRDFILVPNNQPRSRWRPHSPECVVSAQETPEWRRNVGTERELTIVLDVGFLDRSFFASDVQSPP